MRPNLNRRGFTLTEVLIALTISVLLITAVLGAYITSSEFLFSNVAGRNVQSDANLLMNKIIKGRREPTGIFRLSEAASYNPQSVSELHFTGTDGIERWYRLGANNASVIYHHPTANGVQDEVIYNVPQGNALTLRFWIPAGANFTNIGVGIDVALSQVFRGRTVSGSVSTMINIRNHVT